jgi:hypothetical protein
MRCHGDFLPYIPPFSSLDETCGPTPYGGKQEGEEGWCVVMLIVSILTTTDLDFPLFFPPRLAELTFVVPVVYWSPCLAAPSLQMRISEQRPTIGEVNVNILFGYRETQLRRSTLA